MMRGKKAVLALSVLALAAAGCGRSDSGSGGGSTNGGDLVGVTNDTIKLGSSVPLSGPASAYSAIAKAIKAEFDYQNANGGVNGKKIDFVFYDDQYLPDRAVANAKKLVEQDKVLALFNTLGTANNVAIMKYANAVKVPQLFVATGASIFGKDPKANPWTIGWQPSYTDEATVYANWLKQNKPNAKVAVLFQNDSFGADLLGGFKAGIQGSSVTIVKEQSYASTDATVASQVKALANSGADVFLDITTPKFGAQAIATVATTSWKPLHILNAVAASKTAVLKPVGYNISQGILTAAYLKAADDPQWDKDPAMMAFKTNIAKYGPGLDVDDPFTVYGWTVAETMVATLKQAKSLSRADVMDAARHLNLVPPLALTGVNVKSDGDTDGFPIQALQLTKFEGEIFHLQGQVIDASTK
jgi:branched-chain amino acid transport system substrate-binding protein